MTTKDALEKIEKEFDEKFKKNQWHPNNRSLKESVKSFYRTALSTLLQQVGEEAKKIHLLIKPKTYEDKDLCWDTMADIDERLGKLRSRLDSVISSVKGK